MIQQIIVGILVLFSVLYLGRSIYRRFSRKKGAASCGCGENGKAGGCDDCDETACTLRSVLKEMKDKNKE